MEVNKTLTFEDAVVPGTRIEILRTHGYLKKGQRAIIVGMLDVDFTWQNARFTTSRNPNRFYALKIQLETPSLNQEYEYLDFDVWAKYLRKTSAQKEA